MRTRPNRARSDGQCEHTNLEDPDARRLSDKYGKILFVFCGGGCKAVIQTTAATELVRAGLVPSHIMSSSAGTCNALGFVEHSGIVGAEKTLRIWENYITSPEAIYEVHPFIREKLTNLVEVVPQLAQDWGPNRSILRDVRRTTRFLPLVMSLGVRMPLRMAGRAVSFLFRLMDIFETQPKSFRYLAQAQAKERSVNLFIVRPDKVPSGLGLLEINAKVIDVVKNSEYRRMRHYIADLDGHNLRFAPPIHSPLFCAPMPDMQNHE